MEKVSKTLESGDTYPADTSWINGNQYEHPDVTVGDDGFVTLLMANKQSGKRKKKLIIKPRYGYEYSSHEVRSDGGVLFFVRVHFRKVKPFVA